KRRTNSVSRFRGVTHFCGVGFNIGRDGGRTGHCHWERERIDTKPFVTPRQAWPVYSDQDRIKAGTVRDRSRSVAIIRRHGAEPFSILLSRGLDVSLPTMAKKHDVRGGGGGNGLGYEAANNTGRMVVALFAIFIERNEIIPQCRAGDSFR